jgi:hypothetical protein
MMVAGNYAAACPKFTESLRLDAGVGTSLWLGECYERSGKVESGWAQFREAAALAVKNGDPREKVAREKASELEPKLPKLAILVPKDVVTPELKVLRDGEEVGPALWGTPVPIDPSDHAVAVSAKGKKPFKTVAHIGSGPTTESVAIPVLEDEPNAPPEPEAPPASLTSPEVVAPRADFERFSLPADRRVRRHGRHRGTRHRDGLWRRRDDHAEQTPTRKGASKAADAPPRRASRTATRRSRPPRGRRSASSSGERSSSVAGSFTSSLPN